MQELQLPMWWPAMLPLWLILAAFPSLSYAISNLLDKYQLEEYFEGDLGVMELLTVSAFVSAIALPFLVYYGGWSLIPEEPIHLVAFVVVGAIHTALLWFYLKALNEDDTVTVVLFYSLLPIFGLLASWFFLGEHLLDMQMVAMGVTIVGVLIISFEGGRPKWKVGFLMTMASVCWALGDVAFKYVALEENLLQALFWEHLVLTTFGLLMYKSMPKVRRNLKEVYRLNGRKILMIAFISEVLYIVGNVVSAFPLVEVQVAAVHLVQTFQPAWVFLITLLIITVKRLRGKAVKGFTVGEFMSKATATSICIYGLYLLAIHTPS